LSRPQKTLESVCVPVPTVYGTKDLDIADRGNHGRVLGNKVPKIGMFGLGGVDYDVAVDEH
jgi:hypothetical protein